MNTEKKENERGASEDQNQNTQTSPPAKNYDAMNLIGAQIKTPYHTKMDGDSFQAT